MQVRDFLLPRHVLTDVRSTDKAGLLRELSRHASAALGVPADTIAAAVLKREALGSTGMGEGIAIPHARIVGLTKLFGMLARLAQPIDFEAVDGQPVDIIFLLLQPAGSDDDINALACVARKLRDPKVQAELRSAKDSSGIYARLTADADQTT
jgi:PTS system nitrogen regulatory IIA component